jgi:hypothetical protein
MIHRTPSLPSSARALDIAAVGNVQIGDDEIAVGHKNVDCTQSKVSLVGDDKFSRLIPYEHERSITGQCIALQNIKITYVSWRTRVEVEFHAVDIVSREVRELFTVF